MSEAVQAIGYTDDGKVGVLISISLSLDECRQLYEQAQSQEDGVSFAANLSMAPEYVDNLVLNLKIAALEARKKAKK